MYKAIASFWSKSSLDQTQLSHESTLDEESWVFVSNTDSPTMTNSWIASPPLIKTEESSMNVHHFNPIENLLIEHASMSVYEQIASKTRHRRQRKIMNDNKLDEHTEEDEEEDDDDDDDKESINRQSSIHHRNANQSPNSSVTTLDSSTSSLAAHHRHLQRLHQRRKRSKLISTNNIGEPKPVLTKNLDRQRLLTPKALLQQPSRFNH